MPDAYSNDGLYWTSVLPIALRLGIARFGVVSGIVVSAQASPDMTVKTTAGAANFGQTTRTTVAANSSIAIDASDPTDDRYDLISVNSSGTIVYTAGTPDPMAVPPEIPANEVPLAVIYVLAGATTITSAAIYDVRVTTGNVNVPIGAIIPWSKSLAGVPSLPPEFVECNGQTLSDPESPLDGQVIDNLNGASSGTKRFLRGSTTSGSTGGSDSHNHQWYDVVNDAGGSDSYLAVTSVTASDEARSYNSGGTSQTLNTLGVGSGVLSGDAHTSNTSTLPSYYEVVFVMRVK